MYKTILLFSTLALFIFACKKASDCKDEKCKVRAINFTSSTIIGTWDGITQDTIKSGDTVYRYAKLNSTVTFSTEGLSTTIKATECEVEFPFF